MSGRILVGSTSKSLNQILLLAVMLSTFAMLQGCGAANPNYPPSTTVNPNPGITLQAIQITPSTPFIGLAEVRQLYATGVYSDGSSVDISSKVTWSASTPQSPTSDVSINSSGIATGIALGYAMVSATAGPVVGVQELVVDTNGYTSNTIAILSVPYKTTIVDAAYIPESQNLIQGNYAVQEVNLDADHFSSVLPVPLALLASVPMPAGFVPNATIASPTSSLIAVISYNSPDVQIIDASNLSYDTTNNTVINTFTAPVTQTATFNGMTCMICAGVVNPLNNELVLSTAQGYFSMNLTTGTFAALPFADVLPAPTFTLNPIASDPYIISTTFGQNPPSPPQLQIVDLTTNAVTNETAFGVTIPYALPINPVDNYAVLVDTATNDQVLLNFADPQSPTSTPVPSLGSCAGPSGPVPMGMAALGIAANAVPANVSPTLFLGQPSGSCFGFEEWTGNPFNISFDQYGYGPMPATPDGNAFLNGSDPNTIAGFTSVVDKKNYAVLVDANQSWVAKISPQAILGFTTPLGLPTGSLLSSTVLSAGQGGDSVIYLPSPATIVALSENNLVFGNQPVGTPSPEVSVTLTNIGQTQLQISQISIQGTNAGDFSEFDNCNIGSGGVVAQGKCTITITFTPTATGVRSAVVDVTDDGGSSPQTIALSGTGS